jgi:hypothetical protein
LEKKVRIKNLGHLNAGGLLYYFISDAGADAFRLAAAGGLILIDLIGRRVGI